MRETLTTLTKGGSIYQIKKRDTGDGCVMCVSMCGELHHIENLFTLIIF